MGSIKVKEISLNTQTFTQPLSTKKVAKTKSKIATPMKPIENNNKDEWEVFKTFFT